MSAYCSLMQSLFACTIAVCSQHRAVELPLCRLSLLFLDIYQQISNLVYANKQHMYTCKRYTSIVDQYATQQHLDHQHVHAFQIHHPDSTLACYACVLVMVGLHPKIW